MEPRRRFGVGRACSDRIHADARPASARGPGTGPRVDAGAGTATGAAGPTGVGSGPARSATGRPTATNPAGGAGPDGCTASGTAAPGIVAGAAAGSAAARCATGARTESGADSGAPRPAAASASGEAGRHTAAETGATSCPAAETGCETPGRNRNHVSTEDRCCIADGPATAAVTPQSRNPGLLAGSADGTSEPV